MRRGFTMIELILVITIIAILAVLAIPQFIDINEEAELASRDEVVGSVRTGINLIRADDLAVNGPPGNFPANLDAVPDNTNCSTTNPCFVNVLIHSVTDSSWLKSNSTTYIFNDGTTTYTYTYNNVNGTFLSPTAP